MTPENKAQVVARLIDAIEGECDGLSVDAETAARILEYATTGMIWTAEDDGIAAAIAAQVVAAAPSTLPSAPAAPDIPMGAIVNGRTFAERLEATGFECEAGNLRLCVDWVEFRRCFEHLAGWAEALASAPAAAGVPTLDAFKRALLSYADEEYCRSLRMFRTDPCLGWEAKVARGKYGEAEHEAHRKANEHMGAHRGIYAAVKFAEMTLAPTGGEAEQLQTELDAQRYRWLAPRLLAADFDWQDSGECVLVFKWPGDVPVGGNCDQNIDAAMGVHFAAPQSVRTSGEALGTVPSAQGWMPIETAPKDGAVVLLNDLALGGVCIGKWLAGDEWAGWIYDDDLLADNNPLGPQSTHWMPLPPPPGALAAASPEVLPASPDVQDPSRVSASPADPYGY